MGITLSKLKRFVLIFSLTATVVLLGGCFLEGDDGATGQAGPAGATGDTGAPGISTGAVTGTVTDSTGTALQGVAISTNPSSGAATSGADGSYTLADVPIGVYSVTASLDGYGTANQSDVSVGAGLTASADFQLSIAAGTMTSLSGRITDTAGMAIAGATVTLVGTPDTATTDANGDYTITDVPAPGPYFIDVTAPAGSTYLNGGTRRSVRMVALTNSVDDIKLSARPPADAKYIGKATCAICHDDPGAEHETSAHWRSLTPNITRIRTDYGLWPGVGETVVTGVQGLDPVDGDGMLDVYWCQNTAGAYAMKFGGTADCAVADGTLVPVSGTYGGEGDGGIDHIPNVGAYKQRYFAKLADVPNAGGWAYTSGKEKDYLILPVQITESGDGHPKLGGYHGNDWAKQSRTFSRKCAGCHNTGIDIAWNNDDDGIITSFDYKELNISCERCHGPGSKHVSSAGGLANQIINPAYLTPDGESQVCGQCHAADAGHSAVPDTFGYAWNSDHAADVGGGVYVPGVYDIGDFIGNLTTGGFHSWPDGEHSLAHRQQYSELVLSPHTNNPYQRLTCASCHNVHSLYQGPKGVERESHGSQYVFSGSMGLKNNELCLSCHATHGPFADITLDDVAALHEGTVTKDGSALSVSGVDAVTTIGDAVVAHMNHVANMGLFVEYDPETEPGIGRCMTCHMPQTAKSGGYTTGFDALGNTALVEGDQSSHRFDIIAPQVSKAMVKDAGGSDTKIMPNSCGRCHERYRYSAD